MFSKIEGIPINASGLKFPLKFSRVFGIHLACFWINVQWTISLKEAASLLQSFLLWSFADLTLLSLDVLSQQS